MVAVEARRLPLAHRSHFVRPTAEAGEDVLHGQLRLHWTLKVSSEITRLQKISESNPAVARWSAGAFEPAAAPIRAAGYEGHTPPSVRRRKSLPSRLGGSQGAWHISNRSGNIRHVFPIRFTRRVVDR